MTADLTPPGPALPGAGDDAPAGAQPAETDEADRGRRRRRLLVLASVAVGTLSADAATKTAVVHVLADRDPIVVVPHVLDLQLTRNSGAAFSLGAGATIVLTLVALAVVAAIVRVAPRLTSTAWAAALGMLLGGALGNLVDRLLRAPGVGRGAVVDWVHLNHWPVFNLADSAIVAGGALAVLLSARGVHATGAPTPTTPGAPDGDPR